MKQLLIVMFVTGTFTAIGQQNLKTPTAYQVKALIQNYKELARGDYERAKSALCSADRNVKLLEKGVYSLIKNTSVDTLVIQDLSPYANFIVVLEKKSKGYILLFDMVGHPGIIFATCERESEESMQMLFDHDLDGREDTAAMNDTMTDETPVIRKIANGHIEEDTMQKRYNKIFYVFHNLLVR